MALCKICRTKEGNFFDYSCKECINKQIQETQPSKLWVIALWQGNYSELRPHRQGMPCWHWDHRWEAHDSPGCLFSIFEHYLCLKTGERDFQLKDYCSSECLWYKPVKDLDLKEGYCRFPNGKVFHIMKYIYNPRYGETLCNKDVDAEKGVRFFNLNREVDQLCYRCYDRFRWVRKTVNKT